MKLTKEITIFFNKIERQGRTLTLKDMEKIEKDFNMALPTWLKEFFINTALTNTQFEYQLYSPYEDEDGIVLVTLSNIEIMTKPFQCSEINDYLLGKGYICIATEDSFDENPLFINIYEGENPPVYEFSIDSESSLEEIIEEGKHKVIDSLSDLFEYAILEVE